MRGTISATNNAIEVATNCSVRGPSLWCPFLFFAHASYLVEGNPAKQLLFRWTVEKYTDDWPGRKSSERLKEWLILYRRIVLLVAVATESRVETGDQSDESMPLTCAQMGIYLNVFHAVTCCSAWTTARLIAEGTCDDAFASLKVQATPFPKSPSLTVSSPRLPGERDGLSNHTRFWP